jgi:DNA polymerase III subunit epsilon
MPDFVRDKALATQWAQQLLRRDDWVILDTETTGLHGAEVVDVAVINSKGTLLVDTLICPQNPISTAASKIHGLFDADVKDAPTFPEVHMQIKDAIADKEVVIYNAPFDTRILNGVCQLHGLEQLFTTPHTFNPTVKSQRVTCAMKAYAQWYGDWNPQKGIYRWQKLTGGNHRALGDCKATLTLIERMGTIP